MTTDTTAARDITVATQDDRDRVLTTLVAAFAADPVLRFLFPDETTYPRYAAAFFGRLFDKRVHRQTIWLVDGASAVAMWDGPHDDGESRAAPTAGSQPARPSLSELVSADALARVDAYDEAVHSVLPAGRHWYLGVLGTHPDHGGRRLGRAVMAAGLRRAAADGLPAVLETSNPVNVEIYRRSGWRVIRTTRLGPLDIWIMQH